MLMQKPINKLTKLELKQIAEEWVDHPDMDVGAECVHVWTSYDCLLVHQNYSVADWLLLGTIDTVTDLRLYRAMVKIIESKLYDA